MDNQALQIQVNGQPREVSPGTTLEALLQQLQLDRRYLAVERNLQLVPRGEHASTVLLQDDCLEVVTLVGGG